VRGQRPLGVGAILHLTRDDPAWPEEFDQIECPPQQLWARGQLEILTRRPRIAVVGSRSPTPYGIAQTERFASAFAARGVTVVSGMARGIDHAAHQSALEAGGATIALVGCGLDRPWPDSPLVPALIERGLILSEYPPGVAPRRHHFPLRNRLIAGLADGVLVVEAARVSGSLITARWAVNNGREVFAIPGRVDHPMARGCHHLLREGAHLVESPAQVLHLLGLEATPKKTPSRLATPIERALVGETLTADELCSRLDLPVPEVLADLVRLELDGLLVRAPGGLWRLPGTA